MRPLPTAVSVATAAALAALAITVTVPAIGDDNRPDPDAIRACLTAHGATVPDGDAMALKNWAINANTASDKAALQACDIAPDQPAKIAKVAGPDEATLRACLKDNDVNVPDGDGGTLKRWIVGDHTSAEKQALKSCGMAPDPKMTNGPVGTCATKQPDTGTPGDRVKPGDFKKPAVAPAS